MKKRKSFLWLYLAISLVLIVAAVVVSLTAGINLGSDIGGGTQFEVTLDTTSDLEGQVKAVKDVLDDNKVSYEKVYVEDKGIDSNIVVRIAKKDIENQAEIKEDIASKLSIDVSNISDFAEVDGNITNKTIIWTSVTIVGLLILVFFAGWFRYKIMAGVTLMFAVLHAILLSVAILIVTRLPINLLSVIIIICGIALVLFALILTLERVKENMEHNTANESIHDIFKASKKSTLMPLVFLASFVLILTIVLACVPVRFVLFTALTMLVCLVVAGYSYWFVGLETQEKLVEVSASNQKARLSRNDSPAATTKATKRRPSSKNKK